MPEGDDLLTVLVGGKSSRYFRYQYVDLLAEGVELAGGRAGEYAGGDAGGARGRGRGDRRAGEGGTGRAVAADEPPAPTTVKQDDFNPTLYALDHREMEKLQRGATGRS